MEEFSDGGSTPPDSTKKERHDEVVSFFFGFADGKNACTAQTRRQAVRGPGFHRPEGGFTGPIFCPNDPMLTCVA